MYIKYQKSYLKMHDRLSDIDATRVENALLKFATDPFHPSLRNHALK
jgi:hypothetical protein